MKQEAPLDLTMAVGSQALRRRLPVAAFERGCRDSFC